MTTTIGIIGAGHVGCALAFDLSARGNDVVLRTMAGHPGNTPKDSGQYRLPGCHWEVQGLWSRSSRRRALTADRTRPERQDTHLHHQQLRRRQSPCHDQRESLPRDSHLAVQLSRQRRRQRQRPRRQEAARPQRPRARHGPRRPHQERLPLSDAHRVVPQRTRDLPVRRQRRRARADRADEPRLDGGHRRRLLLLPAGHGPRRARRLGGGHVQSQLRHQRGDLLRVRGRDGGAQRDKGRAEALPLPGRALLAGALLGAGAARGRDNHVHRHDDRLGVDPHGKGLQEDGQHAQVGSAWTALRWRSGRLLCDAGTLPRCDFGCIRKIVARLRDVQSSYEIETVLPSLCDVLGGDLLYSETRRHATDAICWNAHSWIERAHGNAAKTALDDWEDGQIRHIARLTSLAENPYEMPYMAGEM
ncbi:hypothetical protein ISF_02053 [Cordyceps fumosorosea ARSEF 2679]|uniref:NAD(P)-binding domain protein n=1 Tax=Cordyceps fumosorosea (strain ARSEF 2679) TaxID=1081104 RepID=A0A162JNJ4_CORFA|nr:hypothetical protein ISF_02053 [Cordyceps fumosorosea ARSEF 2679]OAA71502.1 hypothetical protein ISF_02053 [Cordyceps fumosorosea ARSEF 2679]